MNDKNNGVSNGVKGIQITLKIVRTYAQGTISLDKTPKVGKLYRCRTILISIGGARLNFKLECFYQVSAYVWTSSMPLLEGERSFSYRALAVPEIMAFNSN